MSLLFLLLSLPSASFAQATVQSLDKITGSTVDSGDRFGAAVRVENTRAIIGADRFAIDNGTAYIFEYSAGDWTETSELVPDDPGISEFYGQSVDVSGDLAVIGADRAVYIFRFDGTTWIQEEKISSTSLFGSTVAVEDERVAVGSPAQNQVLVYVFDGTIWSLEATLSPSDVQSNDQFGSDVSLDGNALLVGTPFEDDGGSSAGAAYVFRFDGSSWNEEVKLVASDAQASDNFGESVSISNNLAVIGAPNEDGGTGDPTSGSGAGYIFRFDGSQWSQETILRPGVLQSSDNFGAAVAIDGTGAVVTAPQRFGGGGSAAGAAFIYQFDGSTWIEAARLLASDIESGDRFGASISISQNTVFSGAPNEDGGAGNPQSQQGTVYVFGPPVQVVLPSSVQPGGSFTAAVQLGSAAFPVPEALGAGFSLQYDPTRLTALTATAGPFIDDGDLISESYIDNPNGVAPIGVFRKLANGTISGSGVLTNVDVQAPASAPVDVTAAITVSGVLSVDGSGAVVPVYPVSGFIDLVDGATLEVWPGDTNNSGVLDATTPAVDAADLLPVANCFNVAGPERPGSFNIEWAPQTVDPWTFPTATGDPCASDATFTNPAYADATGDGVINQNDLSAIGLNFGLSRSTFSTTTAATVLAIAPEMLTKGDPLPPITVSGIERGDLITLAVDLSEDVPGLRGAAMTVALPPNTFAVETIEAGSVLDNGDMMDLFDYAPETGELSLATSRKRGAADAGGTGRLSTITLRATRSLNGPAEIRFSGMTASRGARGSVGLSGDDVTVRIDGAAGVDGKVSTFRLDPAFPQPAPRRAELEYVLPEAGPVRASVYDVLGRRVRILVDRSQPAGEHRLTVDTSTLSPGLYFVQLTAGPHRETQRITVVR